MTTLAVTVLLAVPAASAEGKRLGVLDSASQVAVRVEGVQRCPRVLAAIRFYRGRIAEHRARMGAAFGKDARSRRYQRDGRCPRYLAHVLQRKARAWRLRVEAWVEYHYHWWKWMPAKHRRVGACETGYGREPGDFAWDSGTYVSFAGIYRPGYDDDAHRIGNLGWDETKRKLGRLPTPREQMQAVDSHRAAHGGWSGWGCRGA